LQSQYITKFSCVSISPIFLNIHPSKEKVESKNYRRGAALPSPFRHFTTTSKR